MKLKKIVTLVSSAILAFSLVGCSIEGEESSAGSDGAVVGNGSIGFSVSTLNNPFFVTLSQGAKDKAKEEGRDLIVVDAGDDAAKQTSDIEDLISIGTIGLIKSVMTFNSEKGNRLAAYASKCIDNEILMYLRSKKKTNKEVSLYEPLGIDKEGNEIQLYDIIETNEDDASDRIVLKQNIQKLYEELESLLTPRERLVLKMRYGLYNGEEYTQREVARQLGISRSYVSRIEKSAIQKLRSSFFTSQTVK